MRRNGERWLNPHASASFPRPAQAMYLPYAMGAFQLLAGGSLVPALTGIAVGHLYYLLDQALPTTNGVRYLDPPAFLYETGAPGRRPGCPLREPDRCWCAMHVSPPAAG